MRNKSRYSHVRAGRAGEKIETWPGRKQNRVFVLHGHPSMRINLPERATLLFDKDIESRGYGANPEESHTIPVREVKIGSKYGHAPDDPFGLAILFEGRQIALDYLLAHQVATIVKLPT